MIDLNEKTTILVLGLLLVCSVAMASTVRLMPDGDGAYSDWYRTRNCAADWQCIDEYPVSTSDYVFANSFGKISTYTFANMFNATSIDNVKLCFYGARYDSSHRFVRFGFRLNNTDYFDTTFSLPTTYGLICIVYENNPATNQPWQYGEVNNAEAGMNTNLPKAGAKIAQMYLEADYS